jgi:hypothetical protein
VSALEKVAPYYKAVTGLVVPFLGSVGFALTDASAGGSTITTGEWVQALVLGLVGGGTVFSIPNKDPQALHQAESVQPPDGHAQRAAEGYASGVTKHPKDPNADPEYPRLEGGAFDTSILIAVAAVVVIVAGLIYIAQAL